MKKLLLSLLLFVYSIAGVVTYPSINVTDAYQEIDVTVDGFNSVNLENRTNRTVLYTTDVSQEPMVIKSGEKISGFSQNIFVKTNSDYSTLAVERYIGQPAGSARLIDSTGKESFNTVFGELTTGDRTDYINVAFQYNISSRDVNTIITGTGTTSHTTGIGRVHSGTGIGLSRITSIARLRYVTGHEMVSMFTADFGAPEAGVTQKLGIGDTDDGYAGFGYDGTVFGIWQRTIENGLEHIPQSSWTQDKLDGSGASKHTLNENAYNIYMVTYGWLGVAPIRYSIYGGSDIGWIEVHREDSVNTGESPHLANPTLPIQMEVERVSGSGADIEIKTSSWRASIVGELQAGTLADRKYTVKTVLTGVSGTTFPVYSLRSKATFQGLENHVKSRIGTVTISTDGTKAVEFDVYKSGTLTGGTWLDIDTDNSVMEYNNTGTSFTPPASNPVGGTVLGRVDRDRINLISGDVVIPIYAGEELHFVGTTANASDIIVYWRHIEEF